MKHIYILISDEHLESKTSQSSYVHVDILQKTDVDKLSVHFNRQLPEFHDHTDTASQLIRYERLCPASYQIYRLIIWTAPYSRPVKVVSFQI
jgi:hypothetical protein